MSGRAGFVLATLIFATIHTNVNAQGICSAPSNNLICVVPQLYNPQGGVNLPNAAHRAHFDNDFESNAIALTSSVGTELTALRLASPTSGIIFRFDPKLGVMTEVSRSYGPILGERADTIGRHRVFIAATYQFFPFSSLDGIDMSHIPAVYRHADTLNPDGTHRDPTKDAPSPGNPATELEYIRTTNRIDLKVHQVTFYVTYGLTNRLEVSAAVPLLDVHMGVASNAMIVRAADTISQPVSSQFFVADPTSLFGRLYASTGPAADCAKTLSCSGFFHYFDPNNPATSVNATFLSSKTATGIGDAVFRVKAHVLSRERAGIALGTEVRVPSGDEKNFLGSGAPGLKPFIVASYTSRVSPHGEIGYQFNGSSILAGDLATRKEGRLPDQFFYSAGVDAGITRKLTVAVDFLGERLYGAPGVVQGAFVDVRGTSHPDVAQIFSIHHSFNMNDLATGVKFSPVRKLLVTANLQIKLNDGGLRAKVVPLAGISYTF
jgi:hypothetical protein